MIDLHSDACSSSQSASVSGTLPLTRDEFKKGYFEDCKEITNIIKCIRSSVIDT